jgi:hypothetical protein
MKLCGNWPRTQPTMTTEAHRGQLSERAPCYAPEIEMDEKTAREMIDQIGAWLADGAPGATMDHVYETVAADLAREFASSLLDDAKADGMCGCPLCQG